MNTLLMLSGITAILCFIANAVISSWRHSKRSRELGCEQPPAKLGRLLFGIDSAIELSNADRNHVVPQEFMKIYERMACSTFTQSFFGDSIVMTHEPKNIQAVLALQFHDFELGPQRRNNFYPMLGVGIFTADGQTWMHSRSMLRPQFRHDQFSNLDLEEGHVQNMFRHLMVHESGWTSVNDLGSLLFRLTIDSATEFLFGESIHSQLSNLPGWKAKNERFNWDNLAASFDRGTGALRIRTRLAGLYWLYNPKSFRDDCREIRRFADYCIENALKQDKLDSQATSSQPGHGRYIFLRELIKSTKDVVEIRSQLLNILLAGRDTTAGLLGWTFWILARHPKVFNKLRAAVLEDFGTYESPQNMNFARLKTCSYLQYVMNETLRLFPSVPVNARQATRNTSIPRGGGADGLSPVYIKKGQEVCYSAYVLHRRKDIWGADADQYNPDRWEGRKSGWEYIPFNGGPRICLGKQFALIEAGYVIARMVQKFDGLDSSDSNDAELHRYSITTAPLNIFIRFHEAEK